MRPETPPAIRLEDYRVPDYLAETVDLDFMLVPEATRVRARTAFVPNPKGVAGAALELDADELVLVSIALDGGSLGAHEFGLGEPPPAPPPPPQRPFALNIEPGLNPPATP